MTVSKGCHLPTDGAGQLPIYTAALKTPGTERVVARQQARLTVRLMAEEAEKRVDHLFHSLVHLIFHPIHAPSGVAPATTVRKTCMSPLEEPPRHIGPKVFYFEH